MIDTTLRQKLEKLEVPKMVVWVDKNMKVETTNLTTDTIDQLEALITAEVRKAQIEAAKHIDGMLPAEEPTILASRRTEDEDSAWLKAQASFADGFSDDIWRYIRELEAQLNTKEVE